MLRWPTRKRDPHAHAVHAPGARLFRQLRLEVVRRALLGPGRRGPNARLEVTSFLDLLMALTLVLLVNFSPPDGCGCLQRPLNIPAAANVEDVIDAPMVSVSWRGILVDGVGAGSALDVAYLDAPREIPELRRILAGKRELWRQVQPNKPFPGVCILEIDSLTPAAVVKNVVRTVTGAGYPTTSFLVRKLAAPI